MRQVTENLGLDLGGITDEPSLIPNQVTNMIKIDEALGQGGKDDVARAAAAAAQADATQALSDAATASETAAGAATTAAAAETLAQQAVDSSIKVKKLSRNEIEQIVSLSESGPSTAPAIRDVMGIYARGDSYVLNLTPRIKLVSLSINLISNDNFVPNALYTLRNSSPAAKIDSASFIAMPEKRLDAQIHTSFDSRPNLGSSYTIYIASNETTLTNCELALKISGIIWYNQDIDLGTDIV